jgi:hypothetical protein
VLPGIGGTGRNAPRSRAQPRYLIVQDA